MYTMRNTETFCHCQGGGGESAGRICRTRVAVMICSCIERTQGLGCEFEIFTVPKFPASWNCYQPSGILTFPESNAEACERVLQKILGATLVILVVQFTLTDGYVCCLTMEANAIFM